MAPLTWLDIWWWSLRKFQSLTGATGPPSPQADRREGKGAKDEWNGLRRAVGDAEREPASIADEGL